MRRYSKSRKTLPEAHINLTSLLDITFVLLISFMVVAPVVRYSVDLELPKVEESNKNADSEPTTISLQLSSTGNLEYLINGRLFPFDELVDEIHRVNNQKSSEKEQLSLEADKNIPWQDVANLLNHLNNHGFHGIGLIMEQN